MTPATNDILVVPPGTSVDSKGCRGTSLWPFHTLCVSTHGVTRPVKTSTSEITDIRYSVVVNSPTKRCEVSCWSCDPNEECWIKTYERACISSVFTTSTTTTQHTKKGVMALSNLGTYHDTHHVVKVLTWFCMIWQRVQWPLHLDVDTRVPLHCNSWNEVKWRELPIHEHRPNPPK